MTLKEYKEQFRYVGKGATRRVRNSWGSYDFYKWYRVHRPNEHKYVLYECVYFALLKKVNLMLQDELCKTGSIRLPYGMGEIVLIDKKTRTYMYGGKPRTTKHIDWASTLELWYNDKEAEKNKTLVYRDEAISHMVVYVKRMAGYKNKTFYQYAVSRRLRDRVTKRIDCVDGVMYYSGKEAELFKGLYNG